MWLVGQLMVGPLFWARGVARGMIQEWATASWGLATALANIYPTLLNQLMIAD